MCYSEFAKIVGGSVVHTSQCGLIQNKQPEKENVEIGLASAFGMPNDTIHSCIVTLISAAGPSKK